MFALEVLFEGFGVWHLGPADRAGVHKSSFSSSFLVGALSLLLLCCFFGVFLLGLNLLLSTSHGSQLRPS